MLVFASLEHFFIVKFLGAVAVAAAAFLFGVDLNAAMLALLVLMTMDLITGISAAYVCGEMIESRRAFKSALKLGVYCILVASAHLADVAVFGGLHIQEGMIAFLALTELVSLLENAGKMGYGVPRRLLNQLRTLRDSK